MSLSDMNVYASHLSNGSWKGGDKMTITKQIKVGKKKEKKKKRKKDHGRLHDIIRQTPNSITITLFTCLNISCFGYTF